MVKFDHLVTKLTYSKFPQINVQYKLCPWQNHCLYAVLNIFPTISPWKLVAGIKHNYQLNVIPNQAEPELLTAWMKVVNYSIICEPFFFFFETMVKCGPCFFRITWILVALLKYSIDDIGDSDCYQHYFSSLIWGFLNYSGDIWAIITQYPQTSQIGWRSQIHNLEIWDKRIVVH